MKKLPKGNFMKEVVAETAILSALIILPMAFLGPGWRMPYHRPFADAHRPSTAGSTVEEAKTDGMAWVDHDEPQDDFKGN